MIAGRPSPRRPSLSAPRGQLRAAYRLAAGLSPAAVARAEAVAEREITGLLAQPDFQAVVTALRDLQDLARGRAAAAAGAACLAGARAGPGRRRLARRRLYRQSDPPRQQPRPHPRAGAIRAHARAAAPPPTSKADPEPAASPAPPRAPRPYDPVGAAMRRAAAAMRVAVTSEAVLAQEPLPAPSARAEPSAPAQPRRPDPVAARLRGGTASPADRHCRHLAARPAPRLGARPLTVSAARAASLPARLPAPRAESGTRARRRADRRENLWGKTDGSPDQAR